MIPILALIIISEWIICIEGIFILARISNPDEIWIKDKLLSIMTGSVLGLIIALPIIFINEVITVITLEQLGIALLVIIGITIFFVINYLISKLIKQTKKHKKRK